MPRIPVPLASAPTQPHRKRHLFKGLAVFILVAGLGHFAVDTERDRLAQQRRNEVTQSALAFVSRLDAEINANVFLANGMYALINAVPGAGAEQLQAGLQALYRFGRHIRNVGLAPDNRITHIYPLQGNESAIGLYYPDLPEQWPAVKRAMDSRATLLAGPLRLRQGGIGLVSRTPVFREDGSYWGILSLVLDADSLFRAVGLAPEVKGVRYALRGTNALGEKGAVFFGDPAIFAPDAIQYSFKVPGGTWVVAARPAGGWVAGTDYLLALEFTSLTVALALALLAYNYLRGSLRVTNSEKRLRAFMETAQDGVIVIDGKGTILEFNQTAERLFGHGVDEVLGTSLNHLMPPDEAREHDQHIRDSHATGIRRMAGSRQIVGRRKNGTTFPAEITVGNVLVDEERIFVGVVRDISKRVEYERQLLELATTDGLTGTLNRRAFMDGGTPQIQLALRHGRPLALMMVDADHFKKINDTYGHHVGDRVLVHLARVMRDCLRATDRLGRIGGEEFAVLMPETDRDQALAVCERLLQAVRNTSVEADSGEALKFTISIGLTSLEQDSPSIDALMRRADAALYQAKSEGRDRCRDSDVSAET